MGGGGHGICRMTLLCCLYLPGLTWAGTSSRSNSRCVWIESLGLIHLVTGGQLPGEHRDAYGPTLLLDYSDGCMPRAGPERVVEAIFGQQIPSIKVPRLECLLVDSFTCTWFC